LAAKERPAGYSSIQKDIATRLISIRSLWTNVKTLTSDAFSEPRIDKEPYNNGTDDASAKAEDERTPEGDLVETKH
jgi:hypothetical protein